MTAPGLHPTRRDPEPGPRSAGRPVAAFTLLEVLVAVAVFAIVLVALHLVFHGALRLRQQTVQNLDRTVPLEHTLALIRQDLANLTAPGGTLAAGLVDTASSGTMSSNTTGFYGAEFYTTSGRLETDTPWAEIQRVSYQLVDPTNRTEAGRDLVRFVTRNLLPTFDEQPVEEFLLAGVEEFRVEFYDGSEWLEIWDTSTTNTLPLAVRVELRLADPRESLNLNPPTPIQMVVPLEIQSRTTEAAASTDDTSAEGGGA